jgi:1-acyl-sn-glycerol-3-phosphate acyltransferase
VKRLDLWGFDPQFYFEKATPKVAVFVKKYFACDVRFIEPIPKDVPLIFVSNRAGFLPVDAVVAQHVLEPALSKPPPRPLLEDYVFTLPYIGLFLQRIGCVRASRENAMRLLEIGYSVVAFPEGIKGASKTFLEGKNLMRFGRGGIVRLAIASRVKVVPLGIAGVEKAYPMFLHLDRLGKTFGLPFLPVTPLFPFFGPLGLLPLPAKIKVVVGSPIDCLELCGSKDPSEPVVLKANETIRSKVLDLLLQGSK